ncbi:MAG: ParB/RepB/Spo0J family partition protein [Rhodothermales bacterium]|nr:ParB/RepB/Spo0J family partition protein [Rhodothermales bacterium]
MAKKVALGRGLNALLPTAESGGETAESAAARQSRRFAAAERESGRAGSVLEIDVELIQPNPYQPRTTFDEEALDELAASIQQLGIIQPITVRSLGEGRYELISGERRLRAARRAELRQIPAYIREADTEAMLEMAIVENVQREALNPMEVAFGYQRLIEECQLTQEKVAQKVGKKRATVANFLRLLKLPPLVQAALSDNSITMGHARALITVEDEQAQIGILHALLNDGLSVREVEERVRAWQQAQQAPEKKEAATRSDNDAFARADRDQLQIQALGSRLRTRLSTQVHIKAKKGAEGGRIEIEFYTSDDLERLMELLLGH